MAPPSSFQVQQADAQPEEVIEVCCIVQTHAAASQHCQIRMLAGFAGFKVMMAVASVAIVEAVWMRRFMEPKVHPPPLCEKAEDVQFSYLIILYSDDSSRVYRAERIDLASKSVVSLTIIHFINLPDRLLTRLNTTLF